MQKKIKPQSSKQTKAPSKSKPAGKAPKTDIATAAPPTLVITILTDCTLENNQGLDPPHVSKSTGGGFPHQVKFAAAAGAWVCLPKNVFTKDPVNPVAVDAVNGAGPFIIKGATAATQISYSHACDQPPQCTKDGKFTNGDVIIINA